MKRFRVRKWREFQVYKDRNPPWIRLYSRIFEDYEFQCLQDASKLQLILIWLLASRTNNSMPYDAEYIRKQIRVDGAVDLEALERLDFIDVYQDDSVSQASCNHIATPEQSRAEQSTEERQRQKTHTTARAEKSSSIQDFDLFKAEYPKRDGSQPWQKAMKAASARIKEGCSFADMVDGARRYKVYCEGRNMVGTQYVMQAATFLGPEHHFLGEWAPGASNGALSKAERVAAKLDAEDKEDEQRNLDTGNRNNRVHSGDAVR